jgi:hypothetical protein
MWRWVTRGLVLTLLSTLLVPALLAQSQFIGALDFPDPAITQGGVVLVKGWAYDPAQISKIELYIDDQFQQMAVTGLPRIDIIEAYPNWPGIHNSVPGFQTGFLASRFSNGPHTIYMRAYVNGAGSSAPRVEEFGRRTILIDNTLPQPPFGSVDQPDAKGTYNTGGSFPVVGWAADADGIARVDVYIDGGNMQTALYGDARPDVGANFPDFPAALFSGFIANVDTTRVVDGVHTLEIKAVDKKGTTRLIGLRTVQILNSGATLKPFGVIDQPQRDTVLYGTCGGTIPIISPPVRQTVYLNTITGWALDLGSREDLGRVGYAELLVDGVRLLSTDDCTLAFGGYDNCYGIPRYDVERFYPNYPDAPRSGYLFTLDVGYLIGRLGFREGNHVLKVRVADLNQNVTEIPGPQGLPVFFKCSDSTFDAPAFGFIDFPTSFDYVTGNVVFQGWALDQDNVAAVEMIVDGNYVGQAQYGFPRDDVRNQYPQYLTSRISGWRFTMDTTKLGNNRHRLTARVLDGRGNRIEIGSVDFYVFNAAPTP